MVWYNPLSWFAANKTGSRKTSAATAGANAEPRTSASGGAASAIQNTKGDASPNIDEAPEQGQDGSGVSSQIVSDTAPSSKHYRPGIKSHDSVSDRVRHAFRLDHKEHHKDHQKKEVTTEASSSSNE